MPVDDRRATYTAKDLSSLLQCTVQHIRNMDANDQIPGRIKFGRLVRWSKAKIDAWINCEQEPSDASV